MRTDAELVEAAQHGDVDSFAELYRRHYAAAVGIARCWLRDGQAAQDAAQEAFVVACRDLTRLRRPDKFAKWFGAICRNLARRMAKAASRLQPGHEVGEPVAPPPDATRERNELVRDAVQRLSRSAREVIMLRYFAGLSHEQMAATLGISRHSVHGRLIRARRRIAEDLSRNGLGRRER